MVAGRATDAEEDRQRKLNPIDISYDSTVEAVITDDDVGDLVTGNLPDNLDIEPDETEEPTEESIPIKREESAVLEGRYRLLFGQNAFDLLEDVPEQELQPMEQDSQLYSNWNSFLNYLSGGTRIDDIESELGDVDTVGFLNSHTETEIDMDRYFRSPERAKKTWQREYDGREEFDEVTSVLYDTGTRPGEEIETLYALKHIQDYRDGGELQETGLRGLVDQKGVLNQDGERLYNAVRVDQLYM